MYVFKIHYNYEAQTMFPLLTQASNYRGGFEDGEM